MFEQNRSSGMMTPSGRQLHWLPIAAVTLPLIGSAFLFAQPLVNWRMGIFIMLLGLVNLRLLYQCRASDSKAKIAQERAISEVVAARVMIEALEQAHAAELATTRARHRDDQLRLHALWDNATDAMVLCNASGIVQLANRAYCQLYGLPPEEILGKPYVRIYPEAEQSWAQTCYHQLFHESAPGQRFESVLRQADGNTRVLESRVDFLSEHGSRTAMFSVIRDITEQTQLTVDLHEREIFLQAVLDAMVYEIAILDLQGTILAVNAAWRRFANQNGCNSPDAGVGMNYFAICQQARGEDTTDAHAVATGIRAIIAGHQDSFTYEYACHAPSESRWFIARGHRFLGSAQAAVVLAHEDITAQRVAAAEIYELNSRLAAQILELRQHTRELTLLGELSDLLRVCESTPDVFGIVARFVRHLFQESNGTLYMRRPPHTTLTSVVSWGQPSDSPEITVDGCWALRRSLVYAVEDTASGVCCPHIGADLPGSTLCVPLLDQGEVLGILSLSWSVSGLLSHSQQRLAQAVAGQLELALANLRLQDSLRAQAVRDPLTGLFNRRYLEETLERAFAQTARSQQPFAVLVVDIDHFKQINDTFGHDAGDAVLRIVSSFLSHHIRASDLACRYGGEEFVLVLLDAGSAAARQRAESLRAGVTELNLTHRGQALPTISVSIGVALAPDQGATSAALIAAADAALYTAKRTGRNRVVAAGMSEPMLDTKSLSG